MTITIAESIEQTNNNQRLKQSKEQTKTNKQNNYKAISLLYCYHCYCHNLTMTNKNQQTNSCRGISSKSSPTNSQPLQQQTISLQENGSKLLKGSAGGLSFRGVNSNSVIKKTQNTKQPQKNSKNNQ